MESSFTHPAVVVATSVLLRPYMVPTATLRTVVENTAPYSWPDACHSSSDVGAVAKIGYLLLFLPPEPYTAGRISARTWERNGKIGSALPFSTVRVHRPFRIHAPDRAVSRRSGQNGRDGIITGDGHHALAVFRFRFIDTFIYTSVHIPLFSIPARCSGHCPVGAVYVPFHGEP